MGENDNGRLQWEEALKRQRAKKKRKIAGTTEIENILAVDLAQVRVRFQRQQKIGPYTVDFKIQPKLVIEVDGSIHSLPWKSLKDKEKTGFLESKGYTVLRVNNYEIRGGASREVAEKALTYQNREKLRSKRPPK
ncbi:hypothetical protein AUG19_08380 [archaeon 13_1_20CM_2_54_9]|nr:MAG: hypothetical protein AUG19_08380 [archaeon 13_1_20CM_2_54_9]